MSARQPTGWLFRPVGDGYPEDGPWTYRHGPDRPDFPVPYWELEALYPAEPRTKASHVGAPAIFSLELACQHLVRAFGGFGVYLVGSSLQKPDWRDVDLRFIMSDEDFFNLFPASGAQNWEFDPRWLVMTISISKWLSEISGLPVDFQFQPQTHANKVHKGDRHAMGLIFAKPDV